MFIKNFRVKEQCLSIMIFFTPGKTATEIYDMLRLSSEEETVSRTQKN
jgi:hypothetical protein